MRSGSGADFALLVGLTLAGAVCGIGAMLYLPLRIDAVPAPIAAVLFPVLLAGIAVATRRLASDAGAAAAPVIAFFVTVAALLTGAPGDNVFVQDWRLLLLAGCGVVFPVVAVMTATRMAARSAELGR